MAVANKLFVRVNEGMPQVMREETPQLSWLARAAPPPFGVQPDTMGFATRLGVQQLKREGIEPYRLLRRAGLSMAQVEQPDARLSVRGQIVLLDLAAKELNEPFLGHKLALDFEVRQFGLLYYTMASSATVRQALTQSQRYVSIVNAGFLLKYSEVNDAKIAIRYAGVARHSDRQQIECIMTALMRILRTITGRQLAPLTVLFSHHRSEDVSTLRRFFGCAVEFGADEDEIVFDKRVASVSLPGTDPYLNEMLMRYCADAVAHRSSNASSLRTAIENAIVPLLPHGRARLAEVASALGLSARTMGRRLVAEETSFAEILHQLRQELATRYLADANLSISHIAWLLGYYDVSAFSHAFKRWAKKTPAEMREQLRGNAASSSARHRLYSRGAMNRG